MAGTRILRVENSEFYLDTEFSVSIISTNFPAAVKFKSNFRCYLRVYAEFDWVQQKLILELLPSEDFDHVPFYSQKVRHPIKSIEFRKIKWGYLEPLLMTYNTALKKLSIFDHTPVIRQPMSIDTEEDKRVERAEAIISLSDEQLSKIIHRVTNYTRIIEFDYLLKNVIFYLGFVEVEHFSNVINQTVVYRILNPFIIPEFNYIKHHFSKLYGGRKKIKVKAEVTFEASIIINIEAHSLDIEMIDENFIQQVKINRTKEYLRLSASKSNGKILLSSEELLSAFKNADENGNIFREGDAEIINAIMAVKDARNKKHLQYLSGAKQSTKQKIKFSIKPLFGFLFYIEGRERDHYVWELLDSHATYIWSLDKQQITMQEQFEYVVEVINEIHATGRLTYKSTAKDQTANDIILFNSINHNFSTGTIDPFERWKQEAESILI